MDTRPVGISNHTFEKFEERFQAGLSRVAMGNALRRAYYDSLPVTRAEMKRWRIKRRVNCEYRKARYKRATMVMIISADKVIVTVTRVRHDPKASRSVPELRKKRRRPNRQH